MLSFLVCCLLSLALVSCRWSEAQAYEWHQLYPWGAGVNYIPAYADNQIQMWEELDLDHIDR